MKQTVIVANALLLSILVTPAVGAYLRNRGSDVVAMSADPPKPKDINEKYEKLDDFLGTIFTMACKQKHGKDVNGLAKEKLKKGEVEGADGYAAYVKKTQAENVQQLKRFCGMMTSKNKLKCRTECAERWNAITAKRDACDDKCESRYTRFDTSCMHKAGELVKVYKQKSEKAAAQRQCYEGYCKEFPMVWMKSDESAMKKAVDAECKDLCTDANVKSGCQKEWAMEVEVVTATIASDCAEKSGMKKCFDKEKAEVTKAYDKCKKKFGDDCKKAYDTCTKKGNADKNFKDAKAFCVDRKKMCEKQGNQNCLDENKAGLQKADDKCKAATVKELDSCQDKELDKQQKAAEKKCIKETGPKCKSECQLKCQVPKMNKCLKALDTAEDPGKMFCTNFWRLLHTNTETDPVTGDPVVTGSKNDGTDMVLLSSK